jgi:hypothetical protein
MERDDLFFFPQANPWAAYDLWTCSGMVGVSEAVACAERYDRRGA